MADAGAPIRIAVLDMQPITPPVGGGRQRLLGVWHDLGPEYVAEYVGSYDWPGEAGQHNQLTAGLSETTVPLHDRHFAALSHFQSAAGTQSLVDTIFPLLVPASPAYLDRAREAIRRAEIVAFEHPWVYPAVADCLDGKYVVYDSQNVELLLKARGLARNALGRDVLRSVARSESSLIERAHWVMACSTEDKNSLALVYGADLARMSVVPNGVFAADAPADRPERTASDRLTCVFLGSNFGPNVEAAASIAERLAPRLPDVRFVLVGAVSENARVAGAARAAPNVELCGLVSEERKRELLREADVAINPMLSGSGTNIKLFDFMAAGLPVVSTPVGARGVARADRAGVLVRSPDGFADALLELRSSPGRRRELGSANRALALQEFAWPAISRRAGAAIGQMLRTVPRDRPARAATQARDPAGTGPLPQTGAKIAVVSTFGVKCGIAEYAATFVDALAGMGSEVSVFAATTGSEVPSSARHALDVAWHFDNSEWVNSRFEPDQILPLIRSRGHHDHLNIQYHPAFYPADRLVAGVELFRSQRMPVSVTFHNSRGVAPETVARLHALGATMFVHSEDECRQFAGQVAYLPFGLQLGAERAGPGNGGAVRIGTFGFIRPHKGIAELIQAMPIVRTVYPEAVLDALCALYPSADSSNEAERCQALIRELDLADCVNLDTRFHPTDVIEDGMGRMTMAVFPYDQSNEGASAAANTALAMSVPVLTSFSRIFQPLQPYVMQFEDASPTGVALAILDFLGNPCQRQALAERAASYRQEHAWPNVARRFLSSVRLGRPDNVLAEAS